MKQRGKVSHEAKLIAANPNVQVVDRLAPSSDLNEAETEIWIRVVNSFAADTFNEADSDMLVAYCRHMAQADHLSQLIAQQSGEREIDIEGVDKLLKMRERETRAASSLATRLRITKQATTNHRGNKIVKNTNKPWET